MLFFESAILESNSKASLTVSLRLFTNRPRYEFLTINHPSNFLVVPLKWLKASI